jgi:hypothetical protein
VVHAEGANPKKAAERIEHALDQALDHVDAIRDGIFPARIPSCSKSCPSYCEFKDTCREYVPEESHG